MINTSIRGVFRIWQRGQTEGLFYWGYFYLILLYQFACQTGLAKNVDGLKGPRQLKYATVNLNRPVTSIKTSYIKLNELDQLTRRPLLPRLPFSPFSPLKPAGPCAPTSPCVTTWIRTNEATCHDGLHGWNVHLSRNVSDISKTLNRSTRRLPRLTDVSHQTDRMYVKSPYLKKRFEIDNK